MSKYTIGEKVKVSNRITRRAYNSSCKNPKSYYEVGCSQQELKGNILTIKNIDHEGDYLVEENDFQWTDEMLVDVKDKNEDDLVRYMIYSDGPSNKSELVENEEEMKNILKRASKSGEWSGRLIGYQLIPLYEAEEVTTLNPFSRTKITKK